MTDVFFERSSWVDTATARTVQVAFTDVSLDFSERDGADRAPLDEALGRLGGEIAVPVARMRQVHGSVVAEVDGVDTVPTADALVTRVPGLALMTRAADCVPVLLAAGSEGVAAVHAGREGVVAGVVGAAVDSLRAGSEAQVRAWIGPHVCGRCYEVPAAMRDEMGALVPESLSQTSWGTPALDLGAGVAAQLAALGVEVERIGGCTMEDEKLWSHRRSGAAAGRMAGVVWVTP